MIERLLNPGPRGRLAAAAMLIALSLAAMTQLPQLSIDRGDARLIGADDPGWPALHQAQHDFGSEQSVLVYLRANQLWTTARLSAIEKLGNALQDSAGITSV